MSPKSLSDLSLAQVSERLQAVGSSLAGDSRNAVQALLEVLEHGLSGALEPVYHLSAIDPGIGKTLSVCTFLKSWKAAGFLPSSSVLIGLSRLQEIEVYLREAGLDRKDVAILTGDKAINGLGVPIAEHGKAPIMFTTQQMIEKRTRNRSFSETTEFHFLGAPRTLRIWDESLVPAEPLRLAVDDIACLPAALKLQDPEAASRLRALTTQLWSMSHGERIAVPKSLRGLSTTKALSGQGSGDALSILGRLAGREVSLFDGGNGHLSLVGSSEPLPSDFAPVVVLDASGRVRSTYRVWEGSTGGLLRLPSAANDYRHLRVNVWERSVGKTSLQPSDIEEIAQAVAALIDEDEQADDWLIVTYKAHPVDDQVRRVLKTDAGERLNFLTWGMHHGTNAYAHCKKVILIGQQTYGSADYPALAFAAGHGMAAPSAELYRELRDGEYQHHLLQALTRASVRKSRNGLAGVCTAYLVASPNIDSQRLIGETFPGCDVGEWSPGTVKASGRAGELIALMEDARERRVKRVSKKDLRETMGIRAPNLTQLLGHKDVAAYMGRMGVHAEHSCLVLGGLFEPYPGGGFSIDDLGTI